MGWGGARKGAGQKRLERKPIQISLHPAVLKRLDEATNNRSRYINDLLDRVLPKGDEGQP